MGYRRRRISRVLLAVLALTIAVGIFTYVRKLSTSRANDTTVAAALPQPQPQVPPQSQPTAVNLPSGATPVKQAEPAGPLRTETPTALVTQTPVRGAPSIATPVPNAPAGATAATPTAAKAAPGGDPTKISIKPYQPPAGGHNTPGGAAALEDGRAKMQAGKLLEARDALNAPLVAGKFTGGDADAARALLSEINQTVVFSNRKFPDDRFGGTYEVVSGDRLDKIGFRNSLTADMLLKVNGLADARRLRAGSTIKVLKGPFHAVVNKSSFRLDLYLGGLPGSGADVMYVTSYPVGLGKDNSTPVGKWQVEADRKVKNPVYYSPRGEGEIAADDPKNPLGEFWIGLVGLEGEALGKDSYGIHGTIEPETIGKMASMGCIRMRNEDVAVVFAALVERKSTVLVVE